MSRIVADQLRAAKALIDTPEKWAKASYATTANGVSVSVGDPGAACFCQAGAVMRVAWKDDEGRRVATVALRWAWAKRSGVDPLDIDITERNDDPDTTHADVMQVFGEAIAAEEATP